MPSLFSKKTPPAAETPTTDPSPAPAFETLTVADWSRILEQHCYRPSIAPRETPRQRLLFRVSVTPDREIWVLSRGAAVQVGVFCSRVAAPGNHPSWYRHGVLHTLEPERNYPCGSAGPVWALDEAEVVAETVPALVDSARARLRKGAPSRGTASNRWVCDLRTVFDPPDPLFRAPRIGISSRVAM